MNIPISPLMWVSALLMGIISAVLAQKREKNPYLWFAIGFLFGIFGIFAIFFAGGKKKPVENIPLPVPILDIHGPSDKFWYYLDPTQVQKGPMSRDAIRTAWKEGKIDLSTFVWHEEMTEWTPLEKTLKAEI